MIFKSYLQILSRFANSKINNTIEIFILVHNILSNLNKIFYKTKNMFTILSPGELFKICINSFIGI